MNPEPTLRFAPDHPAFAGHFPGFPVVPGVLLLDAMLHLQEQETGPAVAAIASAKFLRPVAPGQTVTLVYEGGAGRRRFEIREGADLVATGQLAMEP